MHTSMRTTAARQQSARFNTFVRKKSILLSIQALVCKWLGFVLAFIFVLYVYFLVLTRDKNLLNYELNSILLLNINFSIVSRLYKNLVENEIQMRLFFYNSKHDEPLNGSIYNTTITYSSFGQCRNMKNWRKSAKVRENT